MPRVPTALLRKARTIDPFLPALLAPCRDLLTAQNELRWLREHVETVAKARRATGDTLAKGALLGQLVRERAKGKPLQYILGTEYVGDLEIKCRPGVLIPRCDSIESICGAQNLMTGIDKIQQLQSHILPNWFEARTVSRPSSVFLTFAQAQVASRYSSAMNLLRNERTLTCVSSASISPKRAWIWHAKTC